MATPDLQHWVMLHVAAERVLAMDGVRNFRDIGGYPTVDGGESRWGRVFRSGRLDETSDADRARIERIDRDRDDLKSQHSLHTESCTQCQVSEVKFQSINTTMYF